MEALSRMISNYLREIFPEGDDWFDILLKVTGVVVGVVALIFVLWFQNEAFGPNVN
jgi:hypothetical protein